MINLNEEKSKIELADSNEFEVEGQTNAKDQEYDSYYIDFENVQLAEISNNIFIEPKSAVENNNETIEQNIFFPLNTPNEININTVDFLNKKGNPDTKITKSEKEKDFLQKEKTVQLQLEHNLIHSS